MYVPSHSEHQGITLIDINYRFLSCNRKAQSVIQTGHLCNAM